MQDLGEVLRSSGGFVMMNRKEGQRSRWMLVGSHAVVMVGDKVMGSLFGIVTGRQGRSDVVYLVVVRIGW